MKIQKLFTVAVLAAMAMSSPAHASCSEQKCGPGTKVKTYWKRDDQFFKCPTAELADYVRTVVGYVSMQVSMGVKPNISPVTGEPEYDGPPKKIIDDKRMAAGVKTLDQAFSLCAPGKNGEVATILNDGREGPLLWVMGPGGKVSYWMPKSHADAVPAK